MSTIWRHTARDFKFFFLSGNTLFFFMLFFLHMRLWTLISVFIAATIFSLLESRGYTVYSLIKITRYKFSLKLNGKTNIMAINILK